MENITYNEFIQNILNTRGRFSCGDEYHERHHIIPKCMGGKDEDNNLIDLFAQEHFVAHKLLATENPNNDSLIYAWSCMAFPNSSVQDRYELSPEEYEEVRIALSNAKKGKPRSEETKRKLSDLAKERYKNSAYCEKMKICFQERSKNEEWKRKLSNTNKEKFSRPENNPMFGKNHTEESKIKMSESHKGIHSGNKNPMYGKTWWNENTPQEKINEWKANISQKNSGENNPNYGVKCTEEKRDKLIQSNPNTKGVVHIGVNGEILGDYRSAREANRLVGIDRRKLKLYCSGESQPIDGTKWMFTEEYKHNN